MDEEAEFDIVVVGGSLAGLLTARECALRGLNVMVLEEDLEVGSPEKCGGLVSAQGLLELGIIPKDEVLNRIETGTIISPNGSKLTINAGRQRLLVLSRRALDKRAAEQASEAGARLEVGQRVLEIRGGQVLTQSGAVSFTWVVDAGGAYSYLRRKKGDVARAVQCDAWARGLDDKEVLVYIDQEATPGFFSWVIPLGDNMVRIGAASVGASPAPAFERLVRRLDANIVKRVAAPLVTGGALESFFIAPNQLVVGDAAGQAKPTTGGGIFTSGMGGVLAGRALGMSLKEGCEPGREYERAWLQRFGKEFKLMSLMRQVYRNLSNKQLEALIGMAKRAGIEHIEFELGSFDEHSRVIKRFISMAGLPSILELAGQALSALVPSLVKALFE